MVIDNFFIHYKKPAQYVYWGENDLDIYKVPDSEKIPRKIKSIENVSISDLNADGFRDIAVELQQIETGLVMTSGHFIFNIFEFEKIPIQEGLRKDLVEWRLQKVFPENINDYVHNFFKLDKTHILSILLKKSLKEKIEDLFAENSIDLIYIGNSTVEIMNHVALLKKTAPDFFIEIEKNLSMVVFLNQGRPYYIRKFRSDRAIDAAGEVSKTVNFVKNSYARVPRTYLAAMNHPHPEMDSLTIKDELAKLEVRELDLKNREELFFLGKNHENQI